MAYKRKLIFLVSLIAGLSLIFVLTFVFDPEKSGERSAAHSWLDPKLSDGIGRIILNYSSVSTEIFKTGDQWFISQNGTEYPARAFKVEDLISTLTKRAPYPLRAANDASHEKLGLTEDIASRITIYGRDSKSVLLDLLIGYEDNTGNDVYIRKAGQNEVRSGSTIVKSFLTGSIQSWYNLRLIPESENGNLDIDGIQRLSIYIEPGEPPQVYSRWNNQWAISGLTVENPDMNKVDSYIRVILNTEADDFVSGIKTDDPMFGSIRATLELSDGSVKTISLSEEDDTGRRFAVVTGSQYVYSLASWAVQRLFRTAADFER